MLTLQNPFLQIEVNPNRGGRLENLYDRASQKNWVWHPETLNSEDVEVGSSFDEHWEGGWDDIFPNDAPTKFRNHHFADHGELWSQAWQLVDQSPFALTLSCDCVTVPVVVTKTFRLAPDRAELVISYHLRNKSAEAIPYLLKLHPALRIESGDEFFLPRCEMQPVDLAFSSIAQDAAPTEYPYVKNKNGQLIAINQVRPYDEHSREFLLCRKLSAGHCGLYNPRTGTRLSLTFKRQQFPYLWFFQSYGGFRGHYVAMLEPSTSPHYDLATALAANTCAILPPEAEAHYDVVVRVSLAAI